VKKYRLVSDIDGNEGFDLQSENYEDAMRDALEILGYSVLTIEEKGV